jgi:hypothetical protein
MTISPYVTPNPLMSPVLSDRQIERFWTHINKSQGHGPNGDCWVWTSGTLQRFWAHNPYPRGFSVSGKFYRPSHISLAIDGRVRPSGNMNALHSCDNPVCVRPDHLRWGTQEENMEEAFQRRKFGPRRLHPDIVREIRNSTERNVDIAARFGVTASCVCNIRKRVHHKRDE